MLLSSLAHAKLLYGDLEGTRSDIDNAWKVLDDLDGVDPSVNAGYYSVAADYYKVCIYPRRLNIPVSYIPEIWTYRQRQTLVNTIKTLFSTLHV